MAVNWNDLNQVKAFREQLLKDPKNNPQEVDAYISSKVDYSQPTQAQQVQQPETTEIPEEPEKKESWLRKAVVGMYETAAGLPKLLLATGEAASDKVRVNKLEKELNEILKKPLTEQSIKKADEIAKKMKDIAEINPALMKQEDVDAVSGNLGTAMLYGAKKGAGTASFLVPGGTVAKGALSGALYGFSQPTEDVGDFWKSAENAIVGGATGAAFSWGLGKIGQKIRADKLKKLGESVSAGGAGEAQASAGAFYADDVMDLNAVPGKVKEATGITIKGGPEGKLKIIPQAFKKIQTKITSLLNNSDDISYGTFFDDFDDEVAKTNWMDNKKVYQEAKKELTKRLSISLQKEGKNSVNAYNLKNELSGEINNIFTKMQKGNPLSPSEEVKYALWSSIKKSLDGVSPQIRELNSLQHGLDDFAKGLSKTKGTAGIKIPFTDMKFGGDVAKGVQDVIGRGISKTGESLGNVPPVLGQVASYAAPRVGASIMTGTPSEQKLGEQKTGNVASDEEITTLFSDLQNKVGTETAPQGLTITLPNGRAITRDEVWNAMIQDPQNKATYNMLLTEFDRRAKETGTAKPLSTAAASDIGLALAGLRGVEDLELALQKDPNAFVKQLVPGQFFSREYDAAAFAVTEAILRMRSGAAVPETEVRRYQKRLMPYVGDSADVVQTKIERAKQILEDTYNLINTNRGGDTQLQYMGE